ncbi:MAG: beta-ketoacyl-ACP synthase II [Firmicutes bacterium]|nr:beta-ketoacyl-ACP synthase II [Bacillota bacterium]
MNRRVVITGIGALTPIGNTAEEFWNGLKEGKCGIDYITHFDTADFKVKVAGELKNFDPCVAMDKKDTKRMDMFSQYAIVASDEAVKSSGIDLDSIDRTRFGISIGSGIGGIGVIEEQLFKLYEKGPSKVSPMFIPMVISNMAAGQVAIKFGAKGTCIDVVTACATGTNSIGEAFRAIRHGYSDYMLAGGAEATVTRAGVAGFASLKALSTSDDPKRASIPFDKERNGFVMGEGAGIVFMESLESAQQRNANIIAEIVGYGSTCDAYHMTSPSPEGEGAALAMKLAMEDGNVNKEDITYINAHGTSTHLNDVGETLAIKKTFGEELAKKINISSTKSMTGHLLGATGGVEAIATALALKNDFVPPTIGYKVPDEECDLNYTVNQGVERKMKYALSNTFGFGGHNGVLCLKKWEE